MYKALIVEDDMDLAEITAASLTHAGYLADCAADCAAAQRLLSEKEYDLILLDEMLPDCRGDALCRKIRSDCNAPIIFMSCRDDSDTIIAALRSGGDDYVVKPINYEVLLARADAIIRRSGGKGGGQTAGDVRSFKSFLMDLTHRCVLRGKEKVELSAIEFSLLKYMTEHPDTLILYQDLYREVWSSDSLGDIRTVMVHISNLRKKIDSNRVGIISTVRNAGYIFSDV